MKSKVNYGAINGVVSFHVYREATFATPAMNEVPE
jgi:hypothetical protein